MLQRNPLLTRLEDARGKLRVFQTDWQACYFPKTNLTVGPPKSEDNLLRFNYTSPSNIKLQWKKKKKESVFETTQTLKQLYFQLHLPKSK